MTRPMLGGEGVLEEKKEEKEEKKRGSWERKEKRRRVFHPLLVLFNVWTFAALGQ